MSFSLAVASALVDEVAQNTDSVLEAAQQLQNREGFVDGLKGAVAGGRLVGVLHGNLGLAIQLCDRAAQSDSSVRLETGETPSLVKSRALFQEGLIAFGQKRFKEAVEYFEQSLSLSSDQTTYYNAALCFLEMKGLFRDRTQDAVAAFRQCIDLNQEAPIAIAAGKELARLGQL